MRFQYEESHHLKVQSIAVIGSFNGFDPSCGQMKKEGNKWCLDMEIETGEHYYRFLINKSIEINDPSANLYLPDQNDKLWSALIVDEVGNRLYNTVEYTVHIEHYNITGNIYEERVAINKKIYDPRKDKKVVARFEFTEVTGVHTVTVLWNSADDELFEMSENNLFCPEGQEDRPVCLWFWLDLSQIDFINVSNQGMWTLKLLIDGEFILEDRFSMSTLQAYTALGQRTLVK